MKNYLLIVLSLFLLACSGEDAPKKGGGMPPAAVKLGQPEVGKMEEVLTIAGSLEAKRSALVSAEIAGVIEKIHVDDGQAVKNGDPLFTIESASLKAELDRAKATVELRQQEKKRAESLFERKAASQYDVDKATALLATAQADRDYARAQLDKADIRAPFTGRAGIHRVNEGSYVQPGTALIPLVQTDPLLLDFSAPETVLSVISEGTVISVTVPAINKTTQARISAIEPMVNEATRSVRIRADVLNEEGALRPGQFARVALPVKVVKNVLWLPEAALFYEGNRKLVMLDNDGKAKRQEVSVAGFKDGRVAIESGLDASAQVVVAGHHKVPFDGMPLMPVGNKEGSKKGDAKDSGSPKAANPSDKQQQAE